MEPGIRLTRKEAAVFMGCALSTFERMLKENLLEGTYFNIGNKKIFFQDRLLKWMEDGGEAAARERMKSDEKTS